MGLITAAEPIQTTPKSGFCPNQPQYPLKPGAVEGISSSDCSARGLTCPHSCVSGEEGQTPAWRFVQDLRAVNAAVHAKAPNAPNPHTTLSQIPPDAHRFTVVDLSNALLSAPVHPDSQYFNSMANHTPSPASVKAIANLICNEALRNRLSSLQLSPGSALLQHVDDLLVAAPTEDSIRLLQHLAREGHKASLQKIQHCQTPVTFLGHVISGQGRTLSQKNHFCYRSRPEAPHKETTFVVSGTLWLS